MPGMPAEASMLINVSRLVTAKYMEVPNASVPEQRVAFAASGHRGSSFEKAFNEWHTVGRQSESSQIGFRRKQTNSSKLDCKA
jgi:hypothetical protein